MIDFVASVFGMPVAEVTPIFLFAQAMGFLTTIFAIISSQAKKILLILTLEILANGFMALTYILLGGVSGSYICLIAVLQSCFSILYAVKHMEVPKGITGAFLLLYIAASVYAYEVPLDILPGACAVLFAIAVAQRKPSGYRFFIALNSTLWLVYDFMVGAYSAMITHGLLLISLIIAIIRYRVQEQDKPQQASPDV